MKVTRIHQYGSVDKAALKEISVPKIFTTGERVFVHLLHRSEASPLLSFVLIGVANELVQLLNLHPIVETVECFWCNISA
jgi:hypothetical protein